MKYAVVVCSENFWGLESLQANMDEYSNYDAKLTIASILGVYDNIDSATILTKSLRELNINSRIVEFEDNCEYTCYGSSVIVRYFEVKFGWRESCGVIDEIASKSIETKYMILKNCDKGDIPNKVKEELLKINYDGKIDAGTMTSGHCGDATIAISSLLSAEFNETSLKMLKNRIFAKLGVQNNEEEY